MNNIDRIFERIILITIAIVALVFMVLCLNGCKCPEYIAGENTERTNTPKG